MVVTGSADRTVRIWERTDEPFFAEEEKENRIESLFEAEGPVSTFQKRDSPSTSPCCLVAACIDVLQASSRFLHLNYSASKIAQPPARALSVFTSWYSVERICKPKQSAFCCGYNSWLNSILSAFNVHSVAATFLGGTLHLLQASSSAGILTGRGCPSQGLDLKGTGGVQRLVCSVEPPHRC